jgi:hypothetical protein
MYVLAASHRTDWSAVAFARIKSVIVTGMKNGVRFIEYGTEVVRAKLRGEASSTSSAYRDAAGGAMRVRLTHPR